jgi:excisionase family DNA binding protein
MNDKPYWSTGDLAQAAGVSREWVRRQIVAGEIQASKAGKEWVISREEAIRWLEQRGIKLGQ